MIPDHSLWFRRSLIVNSCCAVTANFRYCSLCRYLSSFRCQLFAASTVSRFAIRFIAAYRYLRPASLSFVARSSMIIIPSSSSFAFSRCSFRLLPYFSWRTFLLVVVFLFGVHFGPGSDYYSHRFLEISPYFLYLPLSCCWPLSCRLCCDLCSLLSWCFSFVSLGVSIVFLHSPALWVSARLIFHRSNSFALPSSYSDFLLSRMCRALIMVLHAET